MEFRVVLSGAEPGHNEDWAGVVRSAAATDLLVIDGGTSVADRNYIDPVNGDVVWFVASFASALTCGIAAGLGQQDAVRTAVERTYAEFAECSGSTGMPLYAWPIAALTWIRITEADGGFRLKLYCLGDCKALLRQPDGSVRDLDPFVNPQEAILAAETARLNADGIVDAAARRARLLPMLRARREFQNTNEHPATLCLRPKGPFQAREYEAFAPAGAAVLAMTDGFYRLVDVYGLHTPASLAALCIAGGPQAALEQLRGFEANAMDAGVSVKRADDASAVVWQPSPS